MPIFENIEDIYKFCTDYNINDYQELIIDFNVEVVYTDDMPDKYLGLAVPGTRTIFIKKDIANISSEFIEAHETIHILLGTMPAAFYRSSYVSNRRTESQANEGAFFMLLREYINTFDISKENFPTQNFMESYKLPNMYYYQVQMFISEFSSEIFT